MKRSVKAKLIGFLATVSFLSVFPHAHANSARRISIQSTDYVEEGEEPLVRARAAFYRDFLIHNPDIELAPFRPVHLPSAVVPQRKAGSPLLFALLGGAGPNHIVSNLENFQVIFEQNFLYPLDEYIFDVLRDRSGRPVDPDGRPLDAAKSELFYRDHLTGKYSVAVPIARRVPICSEWERLPALFRAASIRDGRVYGIPVLDSFTCIVYRRDLLVEAGLDPDLPPTDWDAFIYCAQKLTDPGTPIRGATVQKGQCGFACGVVPASEWLNYLHQADGEAVHKVKFCPQGHRVDAKKDAELPQKCPRCGKSLLRIRQSWVPAFDSDAGLVALRYYQLLRSLSWIRCPQCGEPVNVPLGTKKPAILACTGPKGCRHPFPYPSSSRIYRGVVRELKPDKAADRRNLLARLFERGEVAMAIVDNPYLFIADLSLPAESVGMMPLPVGWQWVECPHCREPIILTGEMKKSGRAVCPRDSAYVNLARAEIRGGLSANLLGVEMWSMNSSTFKAARDAVWRLMRYEMSERRKVVRAQSLLDGGYIRAVPPSHLLLADYQHLHRAVPRSWALVEQESLSSGRLAPWAPEWSSFVATEMPGLLGEASRSEESNLTVALREAAAKCSAAIRTENPAAIRKRKKGISGILVPLAILVLLAIRWLYHVLPPRKAASSATARRKNLLPWLLLAPALILLVAWVCLPLLRGTQMAFYDWRAVEGKRFLGILNFAALISSPEFWRILLQTVLFVALSLALGFAGPILLALLLAEIPRGKSLFRAIFYLPSLISGLAVALLWRLMYDPTETGFLNWLLLHMPRSTYLILPVLFMVAFAGFSALFFRRREFLPGIILLTLSIGLIVLIPRIEPLTRPINWLGNPAAGGIWAMVCVVLPAAWASAAPGSIIYLAALRGISTELYESAELDGAGVFAKIRHITLAELRPLIAINLIGALVGTFQAIRNIFVLTGGQPDGRTRVLALDVWYNAFVYLRLGYATALAWILASMIIGFAVYKLRRLFREGFRIAESGVGT